MNMSYLYNLQNANLYGLRDSRKFGGLSDGIVGSIISGGASLLGGLFSSGSGHYAAKKAYQATKYAADQGVLANRETNEANLNLANQQNQWNIEQWNRENEYNSASSQRQRLEEAGLNPYLMLDGGSAGTASNVTSADMANQQSPDMSVLGNLSQSAQMSGQADQILGNNISRAGELVGNYITQSNAIKGQELDNEKKQMENDTYLANFAADMAIKLGQGQGLKYDNLKKFHDSKYYADMAKETFNQAVANSRTASANANIAESDARVRDTVNDLAIQNSEQDIKVKEKTIENMVKEGILTEEQANLARGQLRKLRSDIRVNEATIQNIDADTANKKDENFGIVYDNVRKWNDVKSSDIDLYVKSATKETAIAMSKAVLKSEEFKTIPSDIQGYIKSGLFNMQKGKASKLDVIGTYGLMFTYGLGDYVEKFGKGIGAVVGAVTKLPK